MIAFLRSAWLSRTCFPLSSFHSSSDFSIKNACELSQPETSTRYVSVTVRVTDKCMWNLRGPTVQTGGHAPLCHVNENKLLHKSRIPATVLGRDTRTRSVPDRGTPSHRPRSRAVAKDST